jgi:hypothetical protein
MQFDTTQRDSADSENEPAAKWVPQPTAREEVYRIIREVAAEAGTYVTVGDVLGRSRIKHVVDVRHEQGQVPAR